MRLDSYRVLVPTLLAGAALAILGGTWLARATHAGGAGTVAAPRPHTPLKPGIYPLPQSAGTASAATPVAPSPSGGSSSSGEVGFSVQGATTSSNAHGLARPTLWTAPEAPATDHVATLTGLAYGTSYGFAVDARAADGRSAWAPYVLNTPGLGDTTTGTDGGAFLVNGQPFFPT